MREQIESDLFHIEIMLDRLLKIEEYSQRYAKLGIDLTDEMVLDSLSFQLDQAGEQLTTGKLSSEIRERFSDINWKEMKRYRNFISHSYVRKNNAVLIKIFQKSVPAYIEQLYGVRTYLIEELRRKEDGE